MKAAWLFGTSFVRSTSPPPAPRVLVDKGVVTLAELHQNIETMDSRGRWACGPGQALARGSVGLLRHREPGVCHGGAALSKTLFRQVGGGIGRALLNTW